MAIALATDCAERPLARLSYERCGAEEGCILGTVCTSARLVAGGGRASFCTRACLRDADCPGLDAVCVATGTAEPGQCHRRCTFNCRAGTACVVRAGGLVPDVCAPLSEATPPCGRLGQPCCAGTTCATELVCGADRRCREPPGVAYAPCSPPGSECMDRTRCEPALVRGPEQPAGNFCTRLGCVRPTDCPMLGERALACVGVAGDPSQTQCALACSSTDDCRRDFPGFALRCLEVATSLGPLRLCAP